jgi:RNA polymerase sigma-70 factor (ECF subfamily)
MLPNDHSPVMLLVQARAGDDSALGQLLELYRNYLRLMARSLMDQGMQVRLDPSDLVQETFLKAHRQFAQFLGGTKPELVAWLRQILVRNLADQARHDHCPGDLRLHVLLEAALNRSSQRVQQTLASSLKSSARGLEPTELAASLAEAFERLPGDYREVFILRSLKDMLLDESAV